MLIESYLTFNGNCAEAMRFYERTLGGKIEMMMTHAESPMAAQAPAADKNRIMHARMRLGDQALMASDALSTHEYKGMHGFSLSLGYDTAAEGKRVFDALAAGGKIEMPLQETFWADAFGMLVDRFGTPWMVSGGPRKFG
jgi:PhnB protein